MKQWGEMDDDRKMKIHNKGLKPTKKLEMVTMQSKISTTQTFDLLLTVYVENETDYDGIWWNDELDVSKYSAPRGVIFNSKLKEWSVKGDMLT